MEVGFPFYLVCYVFSYRHEGRREQLFLFKLDLLSVALGLISDTLIGFRRRTIRRRVERWAAIHGAWGWHWAEEEHPRRAVILLHNFGCTGTYIVHPLLRFQSLEPQCQSYLGPDGRRLDYMGKVVLPRPARALGGGGPALGALPLPLALALPPPPPPAAPRPVQQQEEEQQPEFAGPGDGGDGASSVSGWLLIEDPSSDSSASTERASTARASTARASTTRASTSRFNKWHVVD